jgi:hypothetical protein
MVPIITKQLRYKKRFSCMHMLAKVAKTVSSLHFFDRMDGMLGKMSTENEPSIMRRV